MTDLGGLEQLLPMLLLCCMIPLFMGRRGDSEGQMISTQMDIWFTDYTNQEAFDTITKATDELREKAMAEAAAKKSRFSFLRRGKKERYTVDQDVSPHVYRVADGNDGPMNFEISAAEGGGTQVKATFTPRTRNFVQGLKTNMPPRKLVAANVTVCPTCGRPKQPEWQVCPYDGTKYS